MRKRQHDKTWSGMPQSLCPGRRPASLTWTKPMLQCRRRNDAAGIWSPVPTITVPRGWGTSPSRPPIETTLPGRPVSWRKHALRRWELIASTGWTPTIPPPPAPPGRSDAGLPPNDHPSRHASTPAWPEQPTRKRSDEPHQQSPHGHLGCPGVAGVRPTRRASYRPKPRRHAIRANPRRRK